MKKNQPKIIVIIVFIALALFIGFTLKKESDNKKAFELKTEQVAGYADTSEARVKNSVITLPDESMVVGLKDGVGAYTSKLYKKDGKATLDVKNIENAFVPGEYKKKEPRQDAIVPMYLTTDSYNGSLYIVLFNDRGDVALEKSHARIGDKDASVVSIAIQGSTGVEDYRVSVIYKVRSVSKELILRVIDGHFDEEKISTSPNPSTPVVKDPKPIDPPGPTVCTMDAKQCPDGSYVGRSGPQCEFAICPVPDLGKKAHVGETVIIEGVSIKVSELAEDSRCQADVTCIWAGQVKVSAQLVSGSLSQQSILTLSGPDIIFASKKISLVGVTPTSKPGGNISSEVYEFEFDIK